jgi:hypothetical protein
MFDTTLPGYIHVFSRKISRPLLLVAIVQISVKSAQAQKINSLQIEKNPHALELAIIQGPILVKSENGGSGHLIFGRHFTK